MNPQYATKSAQWQTQLSNRQNPFHSHLMGPSQVAKRRHRIGSALIRSAARRTYERYLTRGGDHGRDRDDWAKRNAI